MTKSPPTEIVKPEQIYYISHHLVLHDSNAITHLRIVFNASHLKRDDIKRPYAHWL